MPRGGHTNGTEVLKQQHKEYTEQIEKARSLAEAKRDNLKWGQDKAILIKNRLEEYIIECDINNKPLTIAGLIRASGVSKRVWYNIERGDYDYRLYDYMEAHNIPMELLDEDEPQIYEVDGKEILLVPFSQIIEWATTEVAIQRESACCSLKGNPVGNIFLLKSLHGYDDSGENNVKTVNQTLIIASPEESRKAIEMLK